MPSNRSTVGNLQALGPRWYVEALAAELKEHGWTVSDYIRHQLGCPLPDAPQPEGDVMITLPIPPGPGCKRRGRAAAHVQSLPPAP